MKKIKKEDMTPEKLQAILNEREHIKRKLKEIEERAAIMEHNLNMLK